MHDTTLPLILTSLVLDYWLEVGRDDTARIQRLNIGETVTLNPEGILVPIVNIKRVV